MGIPGADYFPMAAAAEGANALRNENKQHQALGVRIVAQKNLDDGGGLRQENPEFVSQKLAEFIYDSRPTAG